MAVLESEWLQMSRMAIWLATCGKNIEFVLGVGYSSVLFFSFCFVITSKKKSYLGQSCENALHQMNCVSVLTLFSPMPILCSQSVNYRLPVC